MVTRPFNGVNGGPSESDLDHAMRFLKFKSILRRWDTMTPNRVDGILHHTIRLLMWTAVHEEGESDWIVRALHPGDMPPTGGAREWVETTGTTSETFVDAALGNGTNIRDDTFIGIYGCQWIWAPVRNAVNNYRHPFIPPVNYVRFTIGGTRVAEWDLLPIWRTMGHQGPSSTATEKLGGMIDFPLGVAESPIIISQNKSLLVSYYEQVPTTATSFGLMFHGFVVEKRGAGDGLNP